MTSFKRKDKAMVGTGLAQTSFLGLAQFNPCFYFVIDHVNFVVLLSVCWLVVASHQQPLWSSRGPYVYRELSDYHHSA